MDIHGLVNQLPTQVNSKLGVCSAGVRGSLRPLQPFDHLVVWETTGKAVAFHLSTKSRSKWVNMVISMVHDG